jgi:hypothetical protein
MGAFYPTVVTKGRTEAVCIAPVDRVSGALTIYRVVANSSLSPSAR